MPNEISVNVFYRKLNQAATLSDNEQSELWDSFKTSNFKRMFSHDILKLMSLPLEKFTHEQRAFVLNQRFDPNQIEVAECLSFFSLPIELCPPNQRTELCRIIADRVSSGKTDYYSIMSLFELPIEQLSESDRNLIWEPFVQKSFKRVNYEKRLLLMLWDVVPELYPDPSNKRKHVSFLYDYLNLSPEQLSVMQRREMIQIVSHAPNSLDLVAHIPTYQDFLTIFALPPEKLPVDLRNTILYKMGDLLKSYPRHGDSVARVLNRLDEQGRNLFWNSLEDILTGSLATYDNGSRKITGWSLPYYFIENGKQLIELLALPTSRLSGDRREQIWTSIMGANNKGLTKVSSIDSILQSLVADNVDLTRLFKLSLEQFPEDRRQLLEAKLIEMGITRPDKTNPISQSTSSMFHNDNKSSEQTNQTSPEGDLNNRPRRSE